MKLGKTLFFPFDVAKKCDEIHKTKRLGRASFHPYKSGRPWCYDPRQSMKRQYFSRARPSSSSWPLLGQHQSWGKEDAQLQISPVMLLQVSSDPLVTLSNTPENFGRKNYACRPCCSWLTKAEWILDVLEDNVLEFYSPSVQFSLLHPLTFPLARYTTLGNAVRSFYSRNL